jgi:hypothetical protein
MKIALVIFVPAAFWGGVAWLALRPVHTPPGSTRAHRPSPLPRASYHVPKAIRDVCAEQAEGASDTADYQTQCEFVFSYTP